MIQMMIKYIAVIMKKVKNVRKYQLDIRNLKKM